MWWSSRISARQLAWAAGISLGSLLMYRYLQRRRRNQGTAGQAPPRYKRAFIRIDQSLIGLIIGKRGARLASLEEECKCLLTIVKLEPEKARNINDVLYLGDPGRETTAPVEEENWEDEQAKYDDLIEVPYIEVIYRSEHQLAYLQKLLKKIVAEVKKPQVVQKIGIPTESIVYVQGRYGRNLRRIYQATKAQVRILLPPDPEMDFLKGGFCNITEFEEPIPDLAPYLTTVVIRGPADSVELAQLMIQKSIESFYLKKDAVVAQTTRPEAETTLEEDLLTMERMKKALLELED
ncbi:unnamed protein product, partial [Mesorhabditis spiculigera]